MGVLRTWLCLNKNCNAEVESDVPNPECAVCECVRVQWIPGGGHISGKSRGIDKTLRDVADRFGLTNLGQHGGTHAGERAEPNRVTPPPSERMYSPMPGFNVPWSNTATAGWANSAYPLKRPFETGARINAASKPIPTRLREVPK